MYVFISILILIASILLILDRVIQNSKGGGLASGFSSSNQIMGVRKTTDFFWRKLLGVWRYRNRIEHLDYRILSPERSMPLNLRSSNK